jgi:hypothetical protein
LAAYFLLIGLPRDIPAIRRELDPLYPQVLPPEVIKITV